MATSRETVQETLDFLNKSLPIRVQLSDVEQYPGLANLLSSITDYITDKGVTNDTHRELQQCQDDLKHEKESWLNQHILYTELQQLLLDFEVSKTDRAPSTASEQFHRAVQETLNLAEITDYLDCNQQADSDTTLLGITRDHVNRHHPHKKHVKSIQQKLIPNIEDRLRHKCETLVHFYEPTLSTDSEQLTFAKASQLPSFLERDQSLLASEKVQLSKDESVREKQFWQYYQTLVESLSILEELIVKHKLQSQTDNDRVTSEWLMARCDGMALKIKLVEMKLLCDTYTAETVAALHKVSRHLEEEMDKRRQDFDKTTHALNTYQAVGMGFDDLVQEYTQLIGELENKQWALKELKQSLDK